MAFYRREVAAFRYDTKKLKYLMISKPQYGANERGIDRLTVDQPRYVRITDIDDYGRLKGGLGVTAESVDNKYLLNKGDLLFARSGNTVGKAYLHKELDEAYLFAGYMIRFQFDRAKVLPEFVFLCTQLQFYKHWVSATQRATGQPNINAEEYRNLEIPVPSIPFQQELGLIYDKSLNAFEARQAEAFNLLNSIDSFLLSELGINLPAEPENNIENRIFTTRRRELAGWRFDPQALHPERHACIEELKKLNCITLNRAALFCRDLRTSISDGLTYVGLENVESNTGRYIPSAEKETVSSAFFFRKGQVLFPKLRPYLNKVFLAPFDGFCSTEFHVIEGMGIRSDFLALFLRSSIVVKQTKHLMSGNTLPRLQTEDIEHLLIPHIDATAQERLVIESNKRVAEAERLLQQAEAELSQAKQKIEAMLLGESV